MGGDVKPWQVSQLTARKQQPIPDRTAEDTSNGIDWTIGPGRAKWNSWTELYNHILPKVSNPNMAKRITEAWYFGVTGRHGGSDLNRVAHGKPPRGKKVGAG